MYGIQGSVNNFLCRAALAVQHNVVDEFGDYDILIHGIGHDLPLGDMSFSWHSLPSLTIG